MIYGMYLSATGVVTNSYRQDVIANNLANSETVGFKRNFALFHERLAEAQRRRFAPDDPLTRYITGGLLVSPTAVDLSQGELEQTGGNLDFAIQGRGYFSVLSGKERSLTRDGRFMVDRAGNLILGSGRGERVLDVEGKPIVIDPSLAPELTVGEDGSISHRGYTLGRIGVFDVPDPRTLVKRGGTLLGMPPRQRLTPATGLLRQTFVERANVDPTLELTQLMDAQRQLEANANMIRYQDQTLGKLVNEVGKIA
jgi:flagellar basal body rod protein FlgG